MTIEPLDPASPAAHAILRRYWTRSSPATELILNTRHDPFEAQRLYARLAYSPAEAFRDQPYSDRWFRRPLG